MRPSVVDMDPTKIFKKFKLFFFNQKYATQNYNFYILIY